MGGVQKLTYQSNFPPQNKLPLDSTQKVVFSTIDQSENYLHVLSQKSEFQRLNFEMSDFYKNESTENLVIPICSLNMANGPIRVKNERDSWGENIENREVGVPVAVKYATGCWHRALMVECKVSDKKRGGQDTEEKHEKEQKMDLTNLKEENSWSNEVSPAKIEEDWMKELESDKTELKTKFLDKFPEKVLKNSSKSSTQTSQKPPKLKHIFQQPDSYIKIKLKMVDFGNTDWATYSVNRFQREVKALAPRFIQDLPPFAYSCEFYSTSQKKQVFIQTIEEFYSEKKKQALLEAITLVPFQVQIEGVDPESGNYIVTAKFRSSEKSQVLNEIN